MPDYLPLVVGNFAPRSVTIDDTLWYSLADVAAMLQMPSSSWAAKRLPHEDVRREPFAFPGSGGAKLLLVTEAGLWRLIMTSSRRPARILQEWLFGTVMPAIREHGVYKAPTDHKTQRLRPDARLCAVIAQGLKRALLSSAPELQGQPS